MKTTTILMSPRMAKSTRLGFKTQTRRVAKDDKCRYGEPGDRLVVKEAAWMWCERVPNGTTPTGRPKWKYVPLRSAPVNYVADHPEKPVLDVVSPATGNQFGWRYKTGRFLPHWAIRTTLEITAVRREPLHAIINSVEDCEAEGIVNEPDAVGDHWMIPDDPTGKGHRTAWCPYQRLWDMINAENGYPWDSNPDVRVITFKKIETKEGPTCR